MWMLKMKGMGVINLKSRQYELLTVKEKFMYEMCSTILKSAAALARHKMSIHGSDDETCIYMFELHFGYYTFKLEFVI